MNENAPSPLVVVGADPLRQGLLLDLGCHSRSDVLDLRRGHGALARHVRAAADKARGVLGVAPACEIVPVVLLYRARARDYTVVHGPAHPPAATEAADSGAPLHEVAPPLVIVLGRAGEEDVRQLRDGRGRVHEDVEETMRLVRQAIDEDGAGRLLLPMVVLYERAVERPGDGTPYRVALPDHDGPDEERRRVVGKNSFWSPDRPSYTVGG